MRSDGWQADRSTLENEDGHRRGRFQIAQFAPSLHTSDEGGPSALCFYLPCLLLLLLYLQLRTTLSPSLDTTIERPLTVNASFRSLPSMYHVPHCRFSAPSFAFGQLTAGSIVVLFDLWAASDHRTGKTVDQLALSFAEQVADGTSLLYQGEVTKNTDSTFLPQIIFMDKDNNVRESMLSPEELLSFGKVAIVILTTPQLTDISEAAAAADKARLEEDMQLAAAAAAAAAAVAVAAHEAEMQRLRNEAASGSDEDRTRLQGEMQRLEEEADAAAAAEKVKADLIKVTPGPSDSDIEALLAAQRAAHETEMVRLRAEAEASAAAQSAQMEEEMRLMQAAAAAAAAAELVRQQTEMQRMKEEAAAAAVAEQAKLDAKLQRLKDEAASATGVEKSKIEAEMQRVKEEADAAAAAEKANHEAERQRLTDEALALAVAENFAADKELKRKLAEAEAAALAAAAASNAGLEAEMSRLRHDDVSGSEAGGAAVGGLLRNSLAHQTLALQADKVCFPSIRCICPHCFASFSLLLLLRSL